MKTLLAAFAACTFIALILILQLAQAADLPRPGDTPKPTMTTKKTAYQISMAAVLVFPNPSAAAVADIKNPQDSDCDMRYTLLLAPSEVERVTGMAVNGEMDFVLFQTELLRPGESLQHIQLDSNSYPFPLYEGVYKAYILAESFDVTTREPLGKNFRVENSLHIMADERDADVAEDGMFDIHVYNSTDGAARYALVLSAMELREVAGISLYRPGRLSEKNSVIELWVSDEVGAHETLAIQPQVIGLPTGEYHATLIRLVDGEAPYGCSRVSIRVKTLCGSVISTISDLNGDLALDYAQAMVNCEYLLSLGNQ